MGGLRRVIDFGDRLLQRLLKPLDAWPAAPERLGVEQYRRSAFRDSYDTGGLSLREAPQRLVLLVQVQGLDGHFEATAAALEGGFLTKTAVGDIAERAARCAQELPKQIGELPAKAPFRVVHADDPR